MSRGIPRTLSIMCLVAILGSLVLHLAAGTACLRTRSASNCQRCCQSYTASESQVQVSPCCLFCCTGLPGDLRVSVPPASSLAVALPGVHDLSTRLAPSPPPPRLSLLIHAGPVTVR